MQGWLKLHREIIDHWIYRDAEYLKVWIEMLVRAKHAEDGSTELIEGQLITIGYAEFIFGRKKWSERLGISEQRLRTLLKKMIDDNMIEVVKTFSKFTLYRVKSYHEFNHQSNRQNNQQETAPQQGELDFSNQHNNHQSNQQLTSNQPASNQQLTTKKNVKNVKNVKKEDLKELNTLCESEIPTVKYSDDFEQFWEVYPPRRKKDKAKTFESWKKSIKAIKPDILIKCTILYSKDRKTIGQDGKYAKMPTTFLNGKTYLDYLERIEDKHSQPEPLLQTANDPEMQEEAKRVLEELRAKRGDMSWIET